MKKLSRIGNSYGFIVDKAILDMLEITMETEVDFRTDGRTLLIIPRESEDRKARFRTTVQRTMRNHASTLRKLAK
jgi:antitoxin component of MazEF toxin-antitoxin module